MPDRAERIGSGAGDRLRTQTPTEIMQSLKERPKGARLSAGELSDAQLAHKYRMLKQRFTRLWHIGLPALLIAGIGGVVGDKLLTDGTNHRAQSTRGVLAPGLTTPTTIFETPITLPSNESETAVLPGENVTQAAQVVVRLGYGKSLLSTVAEIEKLPQKPTTFLKNHELRARAELLVPLPASEDTIFSTDLGNLIESDLTIAAARAKHLGSPTSLSLNTDHRATSTTTVAHINTGS